MAKNVVALFDTYPQAEHAVRELLAAGIDPRSISVVAAGPSGKIARQTVNESGDLAAEGALTGAASGLIVGGLVGLLVGATVLAVPPIGVVIAGPVAGLLTGAGMGMVSGGLLGALIGLEIPEDEAQIFAESVRRGGTIVSAAVGETEKLARVEQVFALCGAVNIDERGILLREGGFVKYDPSAPAFVAGQADFAMADSTWSDPTGSASTWPDSTGSDSIGADSTDVVPVEQAQPRNDSLDLMPANALPTSVATVQPTTPGELEQAYLEDFNRSGVIGNFEQFRPAYQYGHDLALRPEYRNMDWFDLNPEARRIWEQRNPGSWERFAQAIFAGWNFTTAAAATPRATLL